MSNLPQNENYQNNEWTTIKPVSGYKYKPNTRYKNLAILKKTGSPFMKTPTPAPGSFEESQAKQVAALRYGNLLNQGMGVDTQTQFWPSMGATGQPIPTDYGTFAEPMTINDGGIKLSWGTPERPVIKEMKGDVTGQYVEDLSDPNLLVKTSRGTNTLNDQAIRSGRPGFMYSVDHIIPLSLGGADTLANRQLLTSAQNYQKTKAQAIPYTLYAYGDISLNEARQMAMRWKDRDITDVPKPNDVGLLPGIGDKSGIEIAREVAERWKQPKKETFKEKIGKIPEIAKNFGEGWLPDPVREFVKGVASGLSLGFVPYEQDENETAGSELAGKVGNIAGSVGSFFLGSAMISGALKGVAAAKALSLGFKAAKGAEAMAAAKGADFIIDVAGVAKSVKVPKELVSTLNNAPGYLKKIFFDTQRLSNIGKMAATSALVGQGAQFVGNKFNPDVISGKEFSKEQENLVGNILKDLSLGALGGIGSPTLKGTAYAMALPMALSYIYNPDEPLDALTDGVIFGAMHLAGGMKKPWASDKQYKKSNIKSTKGVTEESIFKPGFNDIKMFGGKPYDDPVIRRFEDVVDRTSYASLSHYAPDIFPELKPGESVPSYAHLAEKVQAAKDIAIENIWKRFFYNMSIKPKGRDITIKDLKGFSKKLEDQIDSYDVPKLKGLEKLSRSARKARNEALKIKDAEISKEYGKDYKERTKIEGITTEGEALTLKEALTEIKRITVAARQLYKGGLSAELRNKADLDDLLSFSKANMQGRFDGQENFISPPVIKQIIDTMDDSFMENSFIHEKINPSTKYINGNVDIPGLALSKNNPKYGLIFDDAGNFLPNVSPNLIITFRPETAPIWSMGNKKMSIEDMESGRRAVDPHPENALQAHINIKNKDTGKIESVEVGWVASKHHTDMMNNQEAVKKYLATNGAEGFAPINIDKDMLADVMKREGLDHLVINIDKISTGKTQSTSNPFLVGSIRDGNFIKSIELRDIISKKGNVNPVSMDIAKFNNAVNARQSSDAVSAMNKKIVKPASEYIPKSKPIDNTKNNVVTVHQETTRNVLQDMEKSLNAGSPAQIKDNFRNNFGILFDDQQATAIFNRRNEMVVKDGIKLLVDAINNGNSDMATFNKMLSTKVYLENAVLQSSETGKAFMEMPIVGKIKGTPLGQEEHMVTPEIKTTVTQPAVIKPTVTKPTDISNRIVNNAQRELKLKPSIKPDITKQPDIVRVDNNTKDESIRKLSPEEQKKSIEQEKAVLEEDTRIDWDADEDMPFFSGKEGITPEEFIQNEFSVNHGVVPKGRLERSQLADKIILKVGEEFSGMGTENASNFVKRVLPKLTGEMIPEDLIYNNSKLDKIGMTRDRVSKYFKSRGQEVLNPSMYPESTNDIRPKLNDFKDNISTGKDIAILWNINGKDTLSNAKVIKSSNIKENKWRLVLENTKTNKQYKVNVTYTPETGDYITTSVKFNPENKTFTESPSNFDIFLNPGEMNKYIPKKNYLPRLKAGSGFGGWGNFIKKGLETPIEKNSGKYYFAKAFDTALSDMLGKDYAKIPKLGEILDDYINYSIEDMNASGREVTQTKDIVRDRALGIDPRKSTSIDERRKALEDNPLYKDSIPKESEEVSESGLEPEEKGFKGMHVVSEVQEKNMLRFTPLEDKLSALFAEDVPQGAATAVRAVKSLFLGGKGGRGGLRSYILENIPSANKGSINFKKIEKEAVKTDAIQSIRDQVKKTKAEEAKLELPKYEKILKTLTENDPLNPDPEYLTPEIKQQNINDIMEKIKKFSKIIEETKDGGGGPGFHDGVGGLGDVLGGLWGGAKFYAKNAMNNITEDLDKIINYNTSFNDPREYMNPLIKPVTSVTNSMRKTLNLPTPINNETQLREKLIDSKLFTPEAEQVINTIRIRNKDLNRWGNGNPGFESKGTKTGGDYRKGGEWPVITYPIEQVVKGVDKVIGSDIYNSIGKKFNPETINIDMNNIENSEETFMHEILHSFYKRSQMYSNPVMQKDWNDKWDKLKESGDFRTQVTLDNIDRHMLNSGYDLSDLYSKATERFAFLGAKLFDKSGQIPIELIPFYKEFINVPPPPTFNTKDPFDIRNIYPLGSHGKGGPGFHDGVGGLGSIFGGLWGSVKNVFAKEKNTNPIPSPLPAPVAETAQVIDVDIPKNIPKQYVAAMQAASKHTSIPLKDMASHFTAENGNNWDPKLRGIADPSDFGITQLNPLSISTITGTVSKNAHDYFKDNFGHSFNPEDGNDQILASAVYLNHIRQFGLPSLGIKNPTNRDVIISYNMGPTGYVNSLKPNAPKDLVNRRKRYEALLIRNGVNLDD